MASDNKFSTFSRPPDVFENLDVRPGMIKLVLDVAENKSEIKNVFSF